jgi:hypothetical protein
MDTTTRRDADAVRYIVLRKLASGFRHTLMGELQSVQFLAELGARHMDNSAGTGKARDCIDRISLATTEAIATCHSVIAWLRPEEGATTTFGEAIRQCVKLASEDWRMRSTQATFAVPSEAGEAMVSKAAARELIVTSLLALTDRNPGSLDIEVVAGRVDERVELRVRAVASKRAAPLPASIIYHALGWEDVALLAAAHGVICECTGNVSTLRFALASPLPS